MLKNKGDLLASLFIAVLVSGFFDLIYNISASSGWPILLTISVASFLVSLYLLQNQRKNQRKWEKHPTVFPNPQGGGILGEYMERPWQNELAEIGRRHHKKKSKEKKR